MASPPATTAYIGLGSNLGDRAGFLAAAVRRLHQPPTLSVTAVSGPVETAALAVGAGDPGGPYLNAVARVETRLDARGLLGRLHAVEESLGRGRDASPRGAPRTIDLDLLLFGEAMIAEPGLTVPHPGLALRAFVLEPLAELAPGLIVPGTDGRSVWQLRDALRAATAATWAADAGQGEGADR